MMQRKMTFRHLDENGMIRESDLIVCPDYEWQGMPESLDQEWCPLAIGAEIFALRLRGLSAPIIDHIPSNAPGSDLTDHG